MNLRGQARTARDMLQRAHEAIGDGDRIRFERWERRGRVVRGVGTYGHPTIRSFVGENRELRIGNYSSIANGATFLLGGAHPTDRVTTFPLGGAPFVVPSAHTKVGSDVWIGANALILSGRTIDHGAVVAAGAVVTNDVPAYAIVAGNPARIIRYRQPPETIAELLQIAWWNWPETDVMDAKQLLQADDLAAFIAHAHDRTR